MAGRFWLSIVAALPLAACSGGSPPDIHGLTDQVGYVGQELDIELDGSDPDGGRLEYGVRTDVALEGAYTITETPAGVGVFRWTPLAGDVGSHVFDFSVSDGTHTTTVTINVDIRTASSTAPTFRQPLGSGIVIDPSKTPCVSVDIVVEDPDTASVTISQVAPLIAGAMFNQIDGTTASWMWCPTPQQIAATDRYTLVLSADDGQNAPTIKDYIIVLSQSGKIVINEVDYDQVGTDLAEYVELYNPTTKDASLAGLQLVLVNGATSTSYASIDLSPVGTLASHQYLVIAGAGVSAPPSALKLDPGWTQDAIQNGSPDGLALVDGVAHDVVDALSYEGAITAAMLPGFAAPVSLVEGTQLPSSVADSNTVTGTLCRDPDGQDTNDAATDWKFCTNLTPGAANQP